MQAPIVISLFDKTGVAVQPWAEAGYDCHIFDLQHGADTAYLRENVTAHNLDLMHATPDDILRMIDHNGRKIAFVSAFPPCTHLAVSGARWFKGKGLRALADSVHMFATAADFCEHVGAPYYIENPVSTISTYWRKPDYSYHPWQYSGLEPDDCYTKKTCLWTGGGFRMPEFCCDPECTPDDRIHKAPPGPDRMNFRSATPTGFAQAIFNANNGDL
jgi:hypothetical protein